MNQRPQTLQQCSISPLLHFCCSDKGEHCNTLAACGNVAILSTFITAFHIKQVFKRRTGE